MKKVILGLLVVFLFSCQSKTIEEKEEEVKDTTGYYKAKLEVLRQVKEKEDKDKAEMQKYYKSKAGKINKKHPDWTKEECKGVADKKIWIGMSIWMVAEERGCIGRKNISNYGSGNKYQYYWSDYSPHAFYTKEDDIVYAYN